jgi:hypothetical protein
MDKLKHRLRGFDKERLHLLDKDNDLQKEIVAMEPTRDPNTVNSAD